MSILEDIVLLERLAYPSKRKLMEDALRALLEKEPALRIELAVAKFASGKISLNKAAETAGMNSEEFKEILKSRGIKRDASILNNKVVRRELRGI